MQRTHSGLSIGYDKKVEIKAVLHQFFQEYKTKGMIEGKTNQIEEFTSQNITKKVAFLLEEISKKY
jgi:hypothetical protein